MLHVLRLSEAQRMSNRKVSSQRHALQVANHPKNALTRLLLLSACDRLKCVVVQPAAKCGDKIEHEPRVRVLQRIIEADGD